MDISNTAVIGGDWEGALPIVPYVIMSSEDPELMGTCFLDIRNDNEKKGKYQYSLREIIKITSWRTLRQERRASKVKQPQLPQIVRPFLIADIFLYYCLVAFSTDRCYVIPVRPKLSAPQLPLDLWNQFKYMLPCDTLYCPNDLPTWIFRQKPAQYMNVILIKSNCAQLSHISLWILWVFPW